MPLGTDVIKRRKAFEPSFFEFLGGHLSIPILVHQLQDGVDDIVRLFLVFDLVLKRRAGGCGLHQKQGQEGAYLGFLLRINVVNAVNGFYLFAVPYPISVKQPTSTQACGKDSPVLTGSGRVTGRSSRGQTNLWNRHALECRSLETQKREMEYTHVVFRSHLGGEEEHQNNDVGPKSDSWRRT